MKAPGHQDPIAREETIFNAALEFSDPSKRSAYLNLACEGSPVLRMRLEKMLAAADDSFFDRPPSAPSLADVATLVVEPPPATEPLLISEQIGRYKLLQQIGEGGMGVVYMAEQEEPVRRRVALKIIKLGMDSRSVIARFEAERQALALMDHPNIARVLDGGATDAGRPYFVMELVQGVPITEFCDRNKLDARARLNLLIPVCQAIQSAHQKGVIHRDIKPSNVLVTLHNGEPMPKVIDFGIAKATHQKLTEKTLFTQHATMIGTPAYMSPEQAEMSSLDVDTRADIYSLGVLLYELLTGSTPFPEKRLRSMAYGEMQRVITEEEPEKPSTRLSTLDLEQKTCVARNRSSRLSSLSDLLRGDLDWIVMKCLEKDRTRRYDTANELASDIQRHLANEPVAARRPSVYYRLQKAATRHRTVFVASAAVLVSLLLGLTFSAWQAVEKARAFRRASASEELAKLETHRALGLAEESRLRLRRLNISNGTRLMEEGNLAAALPWLVEGFKADQSDRANEAQHRLRIASTFERCPRPIQMWFVGSEVHGVAISPEGQRVLAAARDGTARMWDISSGKLLGSLPFTPPAGGFANVGFAETGGCAFIDGAETAVVWDTRTLPHAAPELRPGGGIAFSILSPNGALYLVSGGRFPTGIWETSTGRRLRELSPSPSDRERFAFVSATGLKALHPGAASGTNWILSAGETDAVRVWDADTGRKAIEISLEQAPNPSHVTLVRFSRDARWLALSLNAYGSFNTMLWEVASGRLRGRFPHDHHVYDAVFSADGSSLVTCGFDRTARVWDTGAGRMRFGPLSHDKPVRSLAISPGGQFLVTHTDDPVVRMWDLHTGKPAGPPLNHSSRVLRIAFGQDDRTLVTGSEDGIVRVWDLAAAPKWVWEDSASEAELLAGAESRISDGNGIVVSPDGQFRAVSRRTPEAVQTVDIVHAATGRAIAGPLTFFGHVQEMVFSQDSRRLLIAHSGRSARVWDPKTGLPVSPPMESPNPVYTIGFALDSRAVLAACEGGLLRMWDSATAEPLIPPFQHGQFPGVGVYAQVARVVDQGRVLGGLCAEARFWELPQDSRPVEAWEQAAQLLSGQRLGRDGHPEVLRSDELKVLWDSLKREVPGDFSFSTQRVYDWHIWRAETAMGAYEIKSAMPHLQALIAREPERFRFRWLRSRAAEYLNQWSEMADDLRACLHLGVDQLSQLSQAATGNEREGSLEAWFLTRLAAAELSAGNEDVFRDAARLAIACLPDQAPWETVAWMARVLAHGKLGRPEAESLRVRLSRFDAEVRASLGDPSNSLGRAFEHYRSLGPLLFREGDLPRALTTLQRAKELGQSHLPMCCLAMTFQALGRKSEASAVLDHIQARFLPVDPKQAMVLEYPATKGLLSTLAQETEAAIRGHP